MENEAGAVTRISVLGAATRDASPTSPGPLFPRRLLGRPSPWAPWAAVTSPLFLLSLTLLNGPVLWDLHFSSGETGLALRGWSWGNLLSGRDPRVWGGRGTRAVMGPNVLYIFFLNGCSIF